MIRKMEERDKQAVIDLAVEFSRERLEQSGMQVDPELAGMQFDQFIKVPHIEALVAEENGVVVGMIVCFVSPLIFTSQMVGQEVVWYVKKEHRGQGVRLLKNMENILKSLNCVGIMMVGLHGDESCAFYSRVGYTEFQHSYFKRLV